MRIPIFPISEVLMTANLDILWHLKCQIVFAFEQLTALLYLL